LRWGSARAGLPAGGWAQQAAPLRDLGSAIRVLDGTARTPAILQRQGIRRMMLGDWGSGSWDLGVVKEWAVGGAALDTSRFNQTDRYAALMEIVRGRMTNRAFAAHTVPREHFEMILEAARHAPSGANAQPWHYVVVTNPEVKEAIGECFVDEQQHRARLRMGFPTPNYGGVKTAPGLIVVLADFRFVRAFPVLNDGSELDRLYHQNAERILLQSVAASTMSAHLAAAALGYAVWWITAIGQDDIQRQIKPMLGVPEELSVIDVMCFGPPAKPSYKRWKKPLEQIMSWDRFNPECAATEEQIDEWIKSMRHKVMYRDESKID
jgi:5,6-dimethylbenzimidazole synthase